MPTFLSRWSNRPLAALACFALGAIASVPACGGGEDADADAAASTAGEGGAAGLGGSGSGASPASGAGGASAKGGAGGAGAGAAGAGAAGVAGAAGASGGSGAAGGTAGTGTSGASGKGGGSGAAGSAGASASAGSGGVGGIGGSSGGAGGVGGIGGSSSGAGGVGGSSGSSGSSGSGGAAGGGAGSGGAGSGGASGAGGAGEGGGAGTGGGGAGGAVECAGTAPAALVQVSGGYGIDATEVTRCQYKAWLDTNPSTAGQPAECSGNASYVPTGEWPPGAKANHPVVFVDWCDAYAYCKGVGKRLCGTIGGGPTAWGSLVDPSTQWWMACSSGGTASYPYGSTYAGATCNGFDAGNGGTVEVGSMAGCTTAEGVHDLSGNVWEWEDSCQYQQNGSDPCRLRGGSFHVKSTTGMRCDYNYDIAFNHRGATSDGVGFRCCSP